MTLQATFRCEVKRTNITFEGFLLVMNRFNMTFHMTLCGKTYSQSWHSNGFFPSCTDITCLFKLLFLEKLWSHVSHINGFFSSCTDNICTFKLALLVKFELQISHFKNFLTRRLSILQMKFLMLSNNPYRFQMKTECCNRTYFLWTVRKASAAFDC